MALLRVADKDFLYQTRISGGRQGSLVADTGTAAELHAQHRTELLQRGHFGFHDPWAPSNSGFLFRDQFEGRSVRTRLSWRWNDKRETLQEQDSELLIQKPKFPLPWTCSSGLSGSWWPGKVTFCK